MRRAPFALRICRCRTATAIAIRLKSSPTFIRRDHESVIQCNIRDIGERVRFEREREALLVNEQASRMEAEAANRSKDLFLATLSHEVRTPLNAILGWATILRGGNCPSRPT